MFLLVRDVTPDKAIDRLKEFNAIVIHTSFSEEDEAKLKAAFGIEVT